VIISLFILTGLYWQEIKVNHKWDVMAGIMTDMDGESESWDVDDEVMPKDIHEIAVHSLLLRNEETIRTYNADSQQIFSLNTEFNRCTNVIDITDEPTNSESKQTEQHRDYEIVHVSSKKLYVTNISYRVSTVPHYRAEPKGLGLKSGKPYIIA